MPYVHNKRHNTTPLFRQLQKRVAKLGCTMIIYQGQIVSKIRISAPQGYRFEEGLHEYVEAVNTPYPFDIENLLSRLSTGIEVCDDTECEWCNNPA